MVISGCFVIIEFKLWDKKRQTLDFIITQRNIDDRHPLLGGKIPYTTFGQNPAPLRLFLFSCFVNTICVNRDSKKLHS